ncbi:MAG TPA: AAA family ATPase [Ramlibacter sp.]|jgi:5-methylcytosine-specific restriction protein B|uniref:AAA family ATPase n=1 Tax=Ramlibacter sp. TaxID=1917967 RepID=UPI002D32C1CA|nr:AAA family ATPase [Ramlibacter sp.]HZY18982.1 AAA family ATPase [Ramlibacter sp.]
MTTQIMDELRQRLQQALARGAYNQNTIDAQTAAFWEHFGPDVLRSVDGEVLLRLLHGRRDDEPRCMAYWLEFKSDEEFSCKLYGGVGGGSALKFGLYEKQPAGVWVTGSPQSQRNLDLQDAISFARKQRDELVAGSEVLTNFEPSHASDDACATLDAAMRQAAPNLAAAGWAHKYWFLVHPDRLDTFHSPQWQRFHLMKLLQTPPDGAGVLDGQASRFVCTGRFLTLARELGTSMTILGKLLGEQHPHHRYWRLGTTSGSTGESQWPVMRDQGLVSIGWTQFLSDLSGELKEAELKQRIAARLLPDYEDRKTATRKAGEIVNFLREMEENDVVVACEGATVRGIGRVVGPYEYRADLAFPHVRRVQWLSLEEWKLDPLEGPRTTVYPFGRHPVNVLGVESRLAGAAPVAVSAAPVSMPALPALDPWSARVEAALRRKGQVILYGPPGTGKTWRALALAKDLAARHAFRKSAGQLDAQDTAALTGQGGLVRVCTFHPNWGYEDFLEGIRPQATGGVITFLERDGIFKTLCVDAAAAPDKNFYLVIDEINRGDLPRIFGELMTVMELDKRDQSITLPVSAKPFRIPRNVFVVGTMNTADRSISLLDAAVRRRFAFIELMPDTGCLDGRQVRSLPLGPWLSALNARVRKHLKRDARNLQVGHAYLMPAAGINSFAGFARILRDEIVPLLEEYCYDDFHTLQQILGKDLVDAEAGRIVEELFLPEREDDLLQAVRYEEVEKIALTEGTPLAEDDTDLNDDEGSAEANDAR